MKDLRTEVMKRTGWMMIQDLLPLPKGFERCYGVQMKQTPTHSFRGTFL